MLTGLPNQPPVSPRNLSPTSPPGPLQAQPTGLFQNIATRDFSEPQSTSHPLRSRTHYASIINSRCLAESFLSLFFFAFNTKVYHIHKFMSPAYEPCPEPLAARAKENLLARTRR